MSVEHTTAEFAEANKETNIDLAYIRAIGGDITMASQTSDYYQAAIKAAAKCMDVQGRVLRGLSGGMPGFNEVTERIEQDPAWVDLHLCAEMLEGELPAGRQVAKYGHKALEVAGFVVAAPFSAAAFALRARGHEAAGSVVHGATHVMHAPARVAEEVIDSGQLALEVAARRYVAKTYGKLEESYGKATNAAWIWATLLSRTAALPEQLKGIPNYFAGRFLQSVGSMGRSIDELPVPIRTLAVHVANSNELTQATGDLFFEVVANSRRARQQKLRTDEALLVRGSRPDAVVVKDLAATTERYHQLVELPLDDIRSGLKMVLDTFVDEPHSKQAHQETTELFAAIVERVGPFYPENQAFTAVLNEHFEPLTRVAYRYILKAQDVRKGADTAVVRLLTDVLIDQNVGIISKAARLRLTTDLDAAAFDWFAHPYDTFKHNASIVAFMREAYLLDRLRASHSGSAKLDTLRAQRFLRAAQDPGAALVVNSRKLNPVFRWAYENASTD